MRYSKNTSKNNKSVFKLKMNEECFHITISYNKEYYNA